jgi:hypothetical protein
MTSIKTRSTQSGGFNLEEQVPDFIDLIIPIIFRKIHELIKLEDSD